MLLATGTSWAPLLSLILVPLLTGRPLMNVSPTRRAAPRDVRPLALSRLYPIRRYTDAQSHSHAPASSHAPSTSLGQCTPR